MYIHIRYIIIEYIYTMYIVVPVHMCVQSLPPHILPPPPPLPPLPPLLPLPLPPLLPPPPGLSLCLLPCDIS